MGNSKVSYSTKYLLGKTTSLVRALACLHNWLIDEKDVEGIPTSSPCDRLNLISRGGDILINEHSRLYQALNGGDYSDDVSSSERLRNQRKFFMLPNSNHPREQMINKLRLLVIEGRPKPMGSTTTNNV